MAINHGDMPSLFDDPNAQTAEPVDMDAKIAAIAASGRGLAAAADAEKRLGDLSNLRGEDLAAEQVGRIARKIVEPVPVEEGPDTVDMSLVPEYVKDRTKAYRNGGGLSRNYYGEARQHWHNVSQKSSSRKSK